jgi:hypothetical protein
MVRSARRHQDRVKDRGVRIAAFTGFGKAQMKRVAILRAAASLLLILASAGSALAQATAPAASPTTASPTTASPATSPPAPPKIEPAALAILKAASDRLAGAQTMRFTARASYEHFALNGQPLVYMTVSEVSLHRPNRLRVTTPGDGEGTDFLYDGKTMMAYVPDADTVAVGPAPPTIDAMVKQAYDQAAIYFPFVDVIVADPYKDITEGLVSAFVIGKSGAVGGTATVMLALATENVQAQVWIGVDDHLPRMIRAVYPKETGMPRYEVEFSDWKLGGPIADSAFASIPAAKAKRTVFARPDAEAAPK